MRSESKKSLSAVLSTEGRAVRPYWKKSNPKGPKGRNKNKGPKGRGAGGGGKLARMGRGRAAEKEGHFTAPQKKRQRGKSRGSAGLFLVFWGAHP